MIVIFSRIKSRYVKKFLLIAGSITGIYLIIATAVTMTLIAADQKIYTAANATPPPTNDEPKAGVPEDDADNPPPVTQPVEEGDADDGLLKPPARTNFLIIALDQENVLTDALMAGCFYRDTCEIKLMSIPRDLYTRIPDERLKRMRDDGLRPPSNGVMKINALRSYGGKTYGIGYLEEQLGEMLGVQFHYYVEIEIPAFKKTVDLLGGVNMEIPAGGLYYNDPTQDLNIAIPAGMQHLDGEMAEGVVRFRRYPSGDVGRNAVQMEFMKQLIRQALTKEAIMRDPLGIANIILTDVRTDIGANMLRYIPYVTKLKAENIKTYTMPGEGQYIGQASYFLPDEKALPDTINEVFYNLMDANAAQAEPSQVSEGGARNLRIQILNGGRVAGMASSVADILTADGYQVSNIDVYRGTAEEKTRIMVRSSGTGDDLLPYFKNAVVKEDSSMNDAYDIVIIIGRSE